MDYQETNCNQYSPEDIPLELNQSRIRLHNLGSNINHQIIFDNQDTNTNLISFAESQQIYVAGNKFLSTIYEKLEEHMNQSMYGSKISNQGFENEEIKIARSNLQKLGLNQEQVKKLMNLQLKKRAENKNLIRENQIVDYKKSKNLAYAAIIKQKQKQRLNSEMLKRNGLKYSIHTKISNKKL